MKTRTGFVSNSSTSSYIIACKPSDICPHCGRSDPDFIGLLTELAQMNDQYSDDTQVIHPDADEVLENIQREIKGYEEDKMESFREHGKDLDKPYFPWPRCSCQTTGREDIGRCDKYISELREKQAKIEQYRNDGWKIADVDISYHDERIREMFEQAKKNGSLVILDF